jgi:hypothetical protein
VLRDGVFFAANRLYIEPSNARNPRHPEVRVFDA